jgi:squalene monooxygenase
MKMTERIAPDAVVAGAGIAGCATAINLAQQGARVLLLEPNPGQPQRFAGEWLHPPGVRQLSALGVDFHQLSHARGTGFAVYFEGYAEPALLPYARSEESVSFQHSRLISLLHNRVHELPEITFAAGARLLEIAGTAVRYRLPHSEENRWIDTTLIVGADGRASAVRRALDGPATSSVVSHMAGLMVDDLELMTEGYAHVLIGRPGPILIYRVAPRKVRICFDVPADLLKSCRTGPELWSVYRDAFPPKLRRPVQLALETGHLQWAANRLQHRELYGHGCVALVGDAVGSSHPLSASGLTLALLDAECLARTGNIAAYANERLANTRIPELVAHALYRIVAGDDSGSAALRRGLNRVWRDNPGLTSRTMLLLTTDETSLSAFFRIFLRYVGAALHEVGKSTIREGVVATASELSGLTAWLKWLVRNLRRRPAWRRIREQEPSTLPVRNPAGGVMRLDCNSTAECY